MTNITCKTYKRSTHYDDRLKYAAIRADDIFICVRGAYHELKIVDLSIEINISDNGQQRNLRLTTEGFSQMVNDYIINLGKGKNNVTVNNENI